MSAYWFAFGLICGLVGIVVASFSRSAIAIVVGGLLVSAGHLAEHGLSCDIKTGSIEETK